VILSTCSPSLAVLRDLAGDLSLAPKGDVVTLLHVLRGAERALCDARGSTFSGEREVAGALLAVIGALRPHCCLLIPDPSHESSTASIDNEKETPNAN
jgi:hypothetical protein